ncbi:12-oxophytodienoate reductase [Sphingobium estronivorans]|uniref:oxidoreductase n=1 Tax=Sphingobium estronivorans TaxID=1577690 RepID=UPI0013C2EAEE|nr:12-oxophytodienoate reductase [Sphingobium estronivorans]
MNLNRLFTPWRMGSLTLPNRFIVPAMQRHWCDDGCPTPQMADYFRRRIEGGFSLVIGESSAVDHPSATQQHTAAHVFGDAMKGWKRCIDAVHGAGGKMFLQLWHEGAVRKENSGGRFPNAPSISPSGLVRKGVPNGKAASAADLIDLRDAFIKGAVAAQDAGADGIEVHACHGYLLDLFLWPETNIRDDGYGGADIAHRARLHAEIIAGIRERTGPDFVISFRFSQWKEVDYDGAIVSGPAELETMLRLLAEAGTDIFHPSVRRLSAPAWEGSDLGLAGWTKRLSRKPVIAVGSVGLSTDLMTNLFGEIANPSGLAGLADVVRRFNNDEFDLVAVGRAAIGDAAWVEKVRTGRFDELRSFSPADLTEGSDWEMSFVLDAHGGAEPL